MQFSEVLKRCKGQTVVVNNNEERLLIEVEEDFLVLQGGNTQMRLTEFIPMSQVVKIVRADYTAGHSSVSIDLNISGGDQNRNTLG